MCNGIRPLESDEPFYVKTGSLYSLLLIVSAFLFLVPVKAQAIRGMIWDPPEQTAEAISEVYQMHAAGVEAVRLNFMVDEALFTVLDSLDMHVFMDLDLTYMTLDTMADTLEWAKTRLSSVLSIARRHRSIRHIGLLKEGHTSNADFCAYLEQLHAFTKSRAPAGTITYYGSRFEDREQCMNTVDRVLFLRDTLSDSLFLPLPMNNAGIGAIGLRVDDAVSGLVYPDSPEAQARKIERFLNESRQNPELAGYAYFISCWKDIVTPNRVVSLRDKSPFLHSCGIQMQNDAPRPAMDVVQGFFLEQREVFAFERGKKGTGNHYLFILAGWFVVGILVYTHATFPIFQSMLGRYFTAHGFYREAIRSGRERLMTPNNLVIIAFMVAFGISMTLLIMPLRSHPMAMALVNWLPLTTGLMLYSILSRPFVLFLLCAFGFIIYLLLWTVVLTLLSRKEGHSLLPGQVLVLVVWPNWSVLCIMTASLLLPTLVEGQQTLFALLVLAAGSVLAFIAIARTLRDYVVLSRSGLANKLAVGLLNPFILGWLVLVYIGIHYGDRVRYLWHLTLNT